MAVKTKKKGKDDLNRRLRRVMDPAIAKALSHPLRGHILVTLGERIASPNEIAKDLGLAARDLDYHVKVLVEVSMIRLVRTEKRRGVNEHFYELAPPVLYFDARDWEGIPTEVRARFSTNLLQLTIDNALAALRAGTFNARDSHQSHTPMILDEQGWQEVTQVMDRALQEVLGVRLKSDERRKARRAEEIPVQVVMMGFEAAGGPGTEVRTAH